MYYISNETELILYEDKWECSYLHKYDFTGCDGNLILEYLCENSDVEEITILAKKIMEPLEIFVHFLLCYYPDWDEDVLAEVSALISDQNNWWFNSLLYLIKVIMSKYEQKIVEFGWEYARFGYIKKYACG